MRHHMFLAPALALLGSPALAAEQPVAQTTFTQTDNLPFPGELPQERAGPETGIEVFAQCDPRWGSEIIHDRSLCKIGCALFALRRAVEEAGFRYAPLEFLALLNRHHAFRGRNILWGNVTQAVPLRTYRSPRNAAVDLEEVRAHMQRGRYVILQVNNRHWVYASEILGDDIVIEDSRGGERGSLRSRYQNNVTGFAYLEHI